ncbi:MAG: hypothetical protein IJX43_01905 [Alphaproteobacteria bacterium]|nr:hypothetical protein [Alphaproteobacteria bacterium]
MHENINKITQLLNLTMYQTNKLKRNFEQYNMSGLQKRGGLLYAPYAVRGIWGRVWNLVVGGRADLIGPDRILLRAQRGIKFCANGYHCVRVGRYVYYANAHGQVVSRNEFMQNKL